MKRINLVKIGLYPLAVSIFFYMISYFTQSKILFGFMSLAFILSWSYIAYKKGTESNNRFKDIGWANLIPIIFIVVQVLIIIYSKTINVYIPALFSQLYFLSTSRLIIALFSFNEEAIVVISFLLIFFVFSFGFLKGKLNG